MLTTNLMSVEELEQLTESGRHDLICGELLSLPPAGEQHGNIAAEIVFALLQFAKPKALGRCYTAETGLILHRNPDTVLVPDVAFIRSERLSADVNVRFVDGPPDLAIEVVSPSDSLSKVQAKVLEYLEAGTLLVWVIEPRRQTVTVYRADHSAHLLLDSDSLSGEDVLPGFSLLISEIFH